MDDEVFRALARSSPWLWTSMQLSWSAVQIGDVRGGEVRAWIRRPGLMRVQPSGGPVEVVDDAGTRAGTRAYSRAWLGASTSDDVDEPAWEPPPSRFPQDPAAPQPVQGADGLVIARPEPIGSRLEYDDPMYENYRWVAMLDPVELADGAHDDAAADDASGPAPRAVTVHDCDEVIRHRRATLEAVVSPTAAYDPRCGCCPLLHCRVSDTDEYGADEVARRGRRYAEGFRVWLDRSTGVCVGMREIGGEDDGTGFDVVIDEVDVSYPDSLFI